MKKQNKLKRPTTFQEVQIYDQRLAQTLFSMLKNNFEVTVSGGNEDDLFTPKDQKRKNKDTKVSFEDIKRSLVSGESPSIMELPPILFPQSNVDTGVPYLHVRAVSWLNKEQPKTLYHQLLDLTRHE